MASTGTSRDKPAARDRTKIREQVEPIAALLAKPVSLAQFATELAAAATRLAQDQAWQGRDGRMAAELLTEIQDMGAAASTTIVAEDAVPMLRDLLDQLRVRPSYGGHPRIFIWGLLEARLQQADLMVLGGLNEGVWPACPVTRSLARAENPRQPRTSRP